MTPKIELTDVTKSFGDKHVLRGVNLSIAKEESVVVIGGSGTGKSVLLKSILGILSPEKVRSRLMGRKRCTPGGCFMKHLSKFGVTLKLRTFLTPCPFGKISLLN